MRRRVHTGDLVRAGIVGVAERITLAVAVSGAALGAGGPACTSAQLTGESPAYLVVRSLEGASGGDETRFSHTVRSDVLTSGGVFADAGRVSFALGLKDPGTIDTPTEPSPANFITVSRYRVRYVRADGRAVPGVDVPYSFDGAMTLTVDAAGGVGTFVLVRAQSKLEAPLIALRDRGGAIAISTLAEVTFFGRDQAGHVVSVTGYAGVDFADWADPDEGAGGD